MTTGRETRGRCATTIEQHGTERSAALAPFGLTPRQYDALTALVHRSEASGTRLAQGEPRCPAALDSAVADLERRGLVDEVHDERRGLVRLRPTDAGIRVGRAAATAVGATAPGPRPDLGARTWH